MAGEGMERYRWLGPAVPSIYCRRPAMPDLKLPAIAQELRDRAEEALTRAETFRDPETKRLMRQIAETYEEVARRLEREAGAADEA